MEVVPFMIGLSGDTGCVTACVILSPAGMSRSTSMAAAIGDLAPPKGLTGFMVTGGGGVTIPEVY